MAKRKNENVDSTVAFDSASDRNRTEQRLRGGSITEYFRRLGVSSTADPYRYYT
jgi:hypothetical protein